MIIFCPSRGDRRQVGAMWGRTSVFKTIAGVSRWCSGRINAASPGTRPKPLSQWVEIVRIWADGAARRRGRDWDRQGGAWVSCVGI